MLLEFFNIYNRVYVELVRRLLRLYVSCVALKIVNRFGVLRVHGFGSVSSFVRFPSLVRVTCGHVRLALAQVYMIRMAGSV